MNIVNTRPAPPESHHTAANLISGNCKQTAFIGQCGLGPAHRLYLITYEAIVLADSPSSTWNGDGAKVTIDRFCNVTISET